MPKIRHAVRHTPVAPTYARHMPHGAEIDAHRHDDHQIVYAGRGVVAVTTDAGSWVAPGTRALWVPADTVHAHQAHGDVELHFVGLPATTNPLGLAAPAVLAVGPLLRELIVEYTRGAREGGAEGERLEAEASEGEASEAEASEGEASEGEGPEGESPERARLRAVLLDQLKLSPQQPLHLPTPTTPVLRAVCDLLHADPADRRTLAELGREVGASDRTLSRLFRADLGMTFPQWRTQLRLHRALILLSEGTPVTTVANLCGWSSTSAFIDVFRRAFGHTPGSH
ncbi:MULTISPECIES: helix-turn-helix transcriptional regulator [unclassified Streptomyces]|uniref:AraC family transcriptional regulator n=1 Tax=unclassified Streptomyces TaxID=2593676 RepID=UPI00278BE851|nr:MULTISPECIES: helix-turn-helix transcriptional regulator [unclassified Streptomyces]